MYFLDAQTTRLLADFDVPINTITLSQLTQNALKRSRASSKHLNRDRSLDRKFNLSSIRHSPSFDRLVTVVITQLRPAARDPAHRQYTANTPTDHRERRAK